LSVPAKVKRRLHSDGQKSTLAGSVETEYGWIDTSEGVETMKSVAIAVSAALILGACSNWVQYTPTPASVVETPSAAESAIFAKSPFTRAFDKIKAGDYAAAEPFLVQQLANRPEDPYALLAMGTVMEQTDRRPDALIYYRLAARYGDLSPLGETVAGDSAADANARTVKDLAVANIRRLKGPQSG